MKCLKIVALVIAFTMLCATMTCFATFDLTKIPMNFDIKSDVTEIDPGENVVVNISIAPQFTGANAADNAAYHTHTFSYGAYVTYPAGVAAPAKSKITASINGTKLVKDGYAGIGYADVAGTEIPAELVNVQFTITKAEAGQTYTFAIGGTPQMTVDAFDEDNEEAVNGAISCQVDKTDTVTITVKSAAPAVETVAANNVKTVQSADTVDGKPTDWQIGSAVAMQVTVPEGKKFQKMIWAITVDKERQFSPVVALGDVEGDVALAATFINGSKAAFGREAVAAKAFSEVDAIFCDNENVEYFTNAEDAAKKVK